MKNQPYSLSWNLETVHAGGSKSPELQTEVRKLKHELVEFHRKFKQMSDLKTGILHFQELDGQCRDLQEFINCLLAQNVEDKKAFQLQSQVAQLCAECDSLGEEVNALLAELDEESFVSLLANSEIHPIQFHLEERRQIAKEKLPCVQERLIHRLAIDGYHGWNALYGEFMGNVTLPSPFPDEKPLSVGQADNKLSHPERTVRKAWFNRWEEVWTSHEPLAGQILNHLGGFRLNLYQARGWPSVLKEPLICNRMEEETLQTMWRVIEGRKKPLVDYLACKAKLLRLERLSWYDIEAPLPNSSQDTIPFEEAAQLIIHCFNSFSPSMGSFARYAFEQQWIEAENKPGKRPGGFCASFGKAKQSRIFMTYDGSMGNVFTLAHELGHAYHSHTVRDMPIFAQQYKMNVAETASTLAEMVLIDSMIQKAHEPRARLALLDNKLQRATTFLMNIHARFLFELDFYEARRKNYVLPSELNELMENAQKRAFQDALAEWHPHFWVAKQHFYICDVPFYNFPYTFGYLFSQGIYAHLKDNKSRDHLYSALLQDTGRLTVEELAQRHLGVNLKEPHFWEGALKLIEKDIADYITTAKK